MKTMPTAFLLTGMDDSPLLELALEWGWTALRRIAGEVIFVTSTEEVVRATKSASRMSRLRRGSKIYLGPSHQECDGIIDLIERIGSGELAVAVPPG